MILYMYAKGRTNSKWFFQVDVSSKKRTNKFHFTTFRLVFRSFFGRKWRHQKDISKLTDLYYDASGRLVFVRFLEESEDTKKTVRN